MDWMVTVLGIMSRLGPLRSLGGYREVLNRVLTRVDLPRPDSPRNIISHTCLDLAAILQHTNNHNIEVEALSHTLAVPLVGKVGETNIAGQLSSDDVTVISDRRRGLARN
jgi:hypothetical protein